MYGTPPLTPNSVHGPLNLIKKNYQPLFRGVYTVFVLIYEKKR